MINMISDVSLEEKYFQLKLLQHQGGGGGGCVSVALELSSSANGHVDLVTVASLLLDLGHDNIFEK